MFETGAGADNISSKNTQLWSMLHPIHLSNRRTISSEGRGQRYINATGVSPLTNVIPSSPRPRKLPVITGILRKMEGTRPKPLLHMWRGISCFTALYLFQCSVFLTPDPDKTQSKIDKTSLSHFDVLWILSYLFTWTTYSKILYLSTSSDKRYSQKLQIHLVQENRLGLGVSW